MHSFACSSAENWIHKQLFPHSAENQVRQPSQFSHGIVKKLVYFPFYLMEGYCRKHEPSIVEKYFHFLRKNGCTNMLLNKGFFFFFFNIYRV